MARHTASSQGDTPILIQTWFFQLNAYASTCAQYPNEYPNLAFHSSLAVVFFSLLSTRFSRCCSTWESANPVALQLQFSCSLCIEGFFRFFLCSSLVLLRARPFLLPPRPFVTEPSLFSLLFSLFSRCCSFLRSHFATDTSICASGHRLRPKLLCPLATPRSPSRRGFLV